MIIKLLVSLTDEQVTQLCPFDQNVWKFSINNILIIKFYRRKKLSSVVIMMWQKQQRNKQKSDSLNSLIFFLFGFRTTRNIYYYYHYYSLWVFFFTRALIGRFSLKSEWQLVSPDILLLCRLGVRYVDCVPHRRIWSLQKRISCIGLNLMGRHHFWNSW